MSNSSNRLLIGFAAGAASHFVFQGSYGTLLHAAGLLPTLPFSLAPVPPMGVPSSASLAFWAALWGVLYAAVEPGLTWRLGRLAGGVAFGLALPLMGHWLVAAPLHGHAIGNGFAPVTTLIEIGFHAAFGLGLAVLFRAGLGTSKPMARPL